MKKSIDVFCDIIDNYGDIGVVYRLSKELSRNNYSVRIFVNKFDAVSKIISNFDSTLNYQKINGIEFYNLDNFYIENTSSVILETFGIELPESYIEKIDETSKLIINLEYLSAENWIDSVHLKKSISPKPWIEKYFFMPGFSKTSGGIILDKTYLSLVEKIKKERNKYFNDFYKPLNILYDEKTYYVNIFTYKWNFSDFLNKINSSGKKIVFFVLDDKFEPIDFLPENIEVYKVPFMNQEKFDIFINLSDFNFVRGEESFVRALLSEKPFVWNIYPQDEECHLDKLNAFLSCFGEFSDNSVLFHELNNKFNKNMDFSKEFIQLINIDISTFKIYKNNLVKNCDLVTKLLNFIDSKLKNLGGY